MADYLGWVWMAVALVLALIEVGTGTFMFLLFAVAAALAGLAAFVGLPIGAQAVVFLLGTIGRSIGSALTRWWIRSRW